MPKIKRRNSSKIGEEAKIQMAFMEWIKLELPQIFPFVHHSPNGGKRSIKEGSLFKKMGTKAGMPDIQILIPVGNCPGMFIEFKSAKGELTEKQKEMLDLLRSKKYYCIVCRDWQVAAIKVKEYLGGRISDSVSSM